MTSIMLNPLSTTICKTLVLSTSILTVFLILFSFPNQTNYLQTDLVHVTTLQSSSPTNVSHLVFGLVGSTKALHRRKAYIESWWRPNITRGFLYLDTAPTDDLLPWSPQSPPFRISDDTTKLLKDIKHIPPNVARIVHAVIEVFREENEGVRWYIMGDDDSIFFVDNLVDVLSKYDHTRYIYIGGRSESALSNHYYSFDMGFGGAGIIMSYPLAKMVQKNIEDCFRRYPRIKTSDLILMSCINDLGVSMTSHQGLHQIDLVEDVSGLLSSHPKAPLLSLHHFDIIDPIFRSLDRFESAKHLMKAASVDQSRLVQQTICYNRQLSWSFSISWGYSIHIYENIIPRSILKIPLETFKAWSRKAHQPFYTFNVRPLSNDPCKMPHVFQFENVKKNEHQVISDYARITSRGLPACTLAGNHSADSISKIEVLSPVTKHNQSGKTECCDVVGISGMEVAKLKLRECMDNELIA